MQLFILKQIFLSLKKKEWKLNAPFYYVLYKCFISKFDTHNFYDKRMTLLFLQYFFPKKKSISPSLQFITLTLPVQSSLPKSQSGWKLQSFIFISWFTLLRFITLWQIYYQSFAHSEDSDSVSLWNIKYVYRIIQTPYDWV